MPSRILIAVAVLAAFANAAAAEAAPLRFGQIPSTVRGRELAVCLHR